MSAVPSVSARRERQLVRLSALECRALMGVGGVGRLAFVGAGVPFVLPINFAVDRDTVVVRVRDGSLIAALPDGAAVALELDGVDPDYQTGWSVLAQGRLDRVDDLAERSRLADLPLRSYAPAAAGDWRRMTIMALGGRRIV